MRLVRVALLGAALIVAGTLAPGTGEAKVTDRDRALVDPDVAHPGQRVEFSLSGCGAGPHWATSAAFDRRAALDGASGTATVRRDAEPGTYTIRARCGGREVGGRIHVAGRLVWPDLLPADGPVR